MPEFFTDPSFVPGLIGFFAGLFVTCLFFAARLGSARRKARKREKAGDQRASHLQIEKSALENELLKVRASETKLLKKLEERGAAVKTEEEREEELAQFLAFVKSTLQTELRKHEHAIVTSLIGKSPRPAPTATPVMNRPPIVAPAPTAPSGPPKDDRDFVPIQPGAAETPPEAAFEGFMMEPAAEKAESAANALRAALEDPNS